ncbi:MAG: DUF1015 family protein [Clostridiales Family XIII bacterium]|jgi:uncharacterized protein (DUF1015 family)|nr:DUF1015 family protein [Clostridiales Family XIII bacterium]
MTKVRAFRAVRPREDVAKDVAALPYDVMNSDEARVAVRNRPLSFLRVDKAEVDLDPSTDIYDARVYEKAKENFLTLRSDGALRKDAEPHYYIYRLTMDGRTQTGIVGCPSVDDYLADRIKKHELTRADKEADRIRHVDTLNANTGPIFLTHRPDVELSELVARWTDGHAAVFDFRTDDGIRHEGWVIDDVSAVDRIAAIYERIPALYIADGHHRCASAVKVALKRRDAHPDYTGEEEFNYFLAVIFPSDQLKIFDYNRTVKDLNGLSEDDFLKAAGETFRITAADGPVAPKEKHTFGLCLRGKWYAMTALPGAWDDADPVGRLDVSILQNRLLDPILGIRDPRVDKRIDFIGGIRGLGELERRVSEDMTVAFAMYPTTVEDLMDIADAGKIMPPKSTWFEPKLLSGLFIHDLD